MLSKLSKKVFAFDIQKEAIKRTKKLLDDNNVCNVTLINNSNENIRKELSLYDKKISLIIFNLGYLPNFNKTVMTNAKTTLKSIKESIKILNKKGIILVTCYPHKEGIKESNAIINYLNKNNINYIIYRNTNNNNAPFLIEIKNSLY